MKNAVNKTRVKLSEWQDKEKKEGLKELIQCFLVNASFSNVETEFTNKGGTAFILHHDARLETRAHLLNSQYFCSFFHNPYV